MGGGDQKDVDDDKDLDLDKVKKEVAAISSIARKMGSSLKDIAITDTLLTKFRQNRGMPSESTSPASSVHDGAKPNAKLNYIRKEDAEKIKQRAAESKKLAKKFR